MDTKISPTMKHPYIRTIIYQIISTIKTKINRTINKLTPPPNTTINKTTKSQNTGTVSNKQKSVLINKSHTLL